MFDPLLGDSLKIGRRNYRFAEHPRVPGFVYGQDGRASVVYQLVTNSGQKYALKVLKENYRDPDSFELAKRFAPLSKFPGLSVCKRTVLTEDRHGSLILQYSDLMYAMLMPWMDGTTWSDILKKRQTITPEQSLRIAKTIVNVLLNFEQKGIAHGDVSAPNVIISGHDRGNEPVKIELVDVETLYAPKLSRPQQLFGGSPGYAHQEVKSGTWQADMDRFSGARVPSIFVRRYTLRDAS